MKVLKNHYGDDMQFTAGTLYNPWDLKAESPTTAMTVEVKYRTGYTAAQLAEMGGTAIELSKADNPENKNTVLLSISADGLCQMRDITGYTSTSCWTHKKNSIGGNQNMVTTDMAIYTEFDSEWVDSTVRKYWEDKQRRYKEYEKELKKSLRNASKP